jgi:excisionase family DNA binding protein
MTTDVGQRDSLDSRLEDPGPSILDQMMTSSQVATLLQMRLSTVESYARRGLLPSVKVGRHRRFIRSQLERALGTLTNGQDARAEGPRSLRHRGGHRSR